MWEKGDGPTKRAREIQGCRENTLSDTHSLKSPPNLAGVAHIFNKIISKMHNYQEDARWTALRYSNLLSAVSKKKSKTIQKFAS